MKVIVVGCAKTGTKSLAAALTKLDYKVYDFLEHVCYHGNEWEKFFTGKGKAEDFRRMYQDVDVVIDNPIPIFWEEIFSVFPDAKVILTVRESEDEWFKSWEKQMSTSNRNLTIKLIHLLSPNGIKFGRFRRHIHHHFFGGNLSFPFSNVTCNEHVTRTRYRMHNVYVQQKVPKDQLLVYNIKQGWEPLCEFLGVESPEERIAHKNKNGSSMADFLKEHSFMIRMKNEMILSASVLSVVLAFVGCKVVSALRK
ncbi:uncharacterized protein LOC100186007 [Ciona intestinalis]